jgi:hypothetical protein
MSEEKRRHDRFAIRQEFDLIDSDGVAHPARGINISEGGLRCSTARAIPPGARVSFTVAMPFADSSMTVSCEGKVLRCTEEQGRFIVIVDLTDGTEE